MDIRGWCLGKTGGERREVQGEGGKGGKEVSESVGRRVGVDVCLFVELFVSDAFLLFVGLLICMFVGLSVFMFVCFFCMVKCLMFAP